MIDSRLELTREEMRALGYRVIDILVEHFATLRDQRVGRKAVPEEIYAKLSEPPPEHGSAWEPLLEQLQRDVFPSTMHVDHPRFFAFVPGPGNYVGTMAEALAAGFNVFTGTWLGGSAAEALETVTIDWLRQLCGFPDTCRGLFVSGGTMANLTALTVARHVVLDDRLERAVVYMSDQAHSSLEKALRVLGFLPEQIRLIACDDEFRLPPEALAAAVERDRADGKRPFCVIASAGTTNTGAVDPLPRLRALCDAAGMWLHVDGAYGAAAALAEEGRRMLEGLPLADSLSLDPHKWLYQPFECGCVLLSRGRRAARDVPSAARLSAGRAPQWRRGELHRPGNSVDAQFPGAEAMAFFQSIRHRRVSRIDFARVADGGVGRVAPARDAGLGD